MIENKDAWALAQIFDTLPFTEQQRALELCNAIRKKKPEETVHVFGKKRKSNYKQHDFSEYGIKERLRTTNKADLRNGVKFSLMPKHVQQGWTTKHLSSAVSGHCNRLFGTGRCKIRVRDGIVIAYSI